MTLTAPATDASRVPDDVFSNPPGYLHSIVANRMTGLIRFDFKTSATAAAATDEELNTEFQNVIGIAMRDTANDDDAGVAFVRRTDLSGSDPYSYTPTNAEEVKTWLAALTSTSDVEVVLYNANRRCVSEPLNRWYIVQSAVAAKYQSLTVYQSTPKALPLQATDRPTGTYVFSLDLLTDIGLWSRTRPTQVAGEVIFRRERRGGFNTRKHMDRSSGGLDVARANRGRRRGVRRVPTVAHKAAHTEPNRVFASHRLGD